MLSLQSFGNNVLGMEKKLTVKFLLLPETMLGFFLHIIFFIASNDLELSPFYRWGVCDLY